MHTTYTLRTEYSHDDNGLRCKTPPDTIGPALLAENSRLRAELAAAQRDVSFAADVNAGCDIGRGGELFRQVKVVLGPGKTVDQMRIAELEADLAAAKAEIVALREAVQARNDWETADRDFECAKYRLPVAVEKEQRERVAALWKLAYQLEDETLARTSASYAHLELIDRETLRKAVEALTANANLYPDLHQLLTGWHCDVAWSEWDTHVFDQMILDQQKVEAALALLTKGQP